ncbi:MAG: metallophosphoesterase, partial [Clostridia bacterium]|nr:metallophosphoesterase [Clostridia bacterium]
MKKFRSILSVLLTALLVCACLVPAGAAVEIEASPLQVHEDGSFKICMFNDLQDKRNPNANTMAMVEAILDSEQPDLVVIAGDSISDTYVTASADDVEATIKALMKPIADRNIPYLFTFGNHDHDAADALSLEGQIAACKSYDSCIIPDDGCDPGTYNVPVLNSDGTGYAFNVYM